MAIHSRSLGCKKWGRKRFPKSGEMGGRGKGTSVGGGKREKRLLFFSYTRYYQVVYQPKKNLNGEQGGEDRSSLVWNVVGIDFWEGKGKCLTCTTRMFEQ